MSPDARKAVITGLGIVSPFGLGKKVFTRALREGRTAIRPVTLFKTRGLPCRLGAEIPTSALDRDDKGAEVSARNQRLGLAAARLAFEDAGLAFPVKPRDRRTCGVAIGVSAGGMEAFLQLSRAVQREGPSAVDPLQFPYLGRNATASEISIRGNIRGFNCTLSGDTQSGGQAFFFAQTMIERYGYDVVLAGGLDEMSLSIYRSLVKRGELSGSKTRGDREVCCPYDARRNGFVVGEGACLMILEESRHAERRKARVYGKILSQRSAFDSSVPIRPFARSVEHAAETIRRAIHEFGYPGRKIDAIFGSADSSRDLDALEARAVRRAFGDAARDIPMTSIKSMIGNTLGARTAFDTAAALCALEGGFLPPTLHFRHPDPGVSLRIVAPVGMRRRLETILITAFAGDGRGGAWIIGK